MKKLFVLALAAALTPIAAARVWTSVYRYDGTTPLETVDPNRPNAYRDIMVGTRLTLVISSDTSGCWAGSLRLSWDGAEYAKLSGKGKTTTLLRSIMKVPNYVDSCLDAAGTGAVAYDRQGPDGIGLEFSNSCTPYITGGHPAVPGDWFVCDYRAEQIGRCDVGFASYDVPIQTLSFTHVPSRDFNRDTVVNLKDFALLASHWRSAADPNSNDKAALDLNADGRIDVSDLASFSEYWLERTDYNEPPATSDPAAQP